MSKSNLVIIPSRSRPDRAAEAIEHLKNFSMISDLCLAIDDDQAELYPRIDDVIYEVNPRLYLTGTLNLVAMKYADKYETITFLGDDCAVRTADWDLKLYEPIKERGYGITYPDDLYQRENLPTHVMISTNIVRALGYMAPPALTHLYVDNFFMRLGNLLNCLDYCPDVVIEHLHVFAQKSKMDETYAEVNSVAMYEHDRRAFEDYCENELIRDLKKITEAVWWN